MIIGIIGAQGNFGSRLEKRVREIKPSDVEIFGTKNRNDTRKIIEISDVIILTIPQSKSKELFEQINKYSKQKALVISFLAHFPIEEVKSGTKRNVIRAMSDPWFNFSAFIKNDIQILSSLDFFFKNITKTQPLFLSKNKDIDLFTINFCYLFVVLLLNEQNLLKSQDIHFEYLSHVLNISKNELNMYTPKGNPKELLNLLATKGGITEMIHSLFVFNPDILPKDIIGEVSKKFI